MSEYHYPFTGEAAFTSSDPELNRLYQAGIRTTELNSFDAFTDCPTREQRAWVGDGVVHQMVHLVANEDWRLARNYVTLGASPRADGMLPMRWSARSSTAAATPSPTGRCTGSTASGTCSATTATGRRRCGCCPVVERVLRWYEPYIDDHGTLSDVPEWNLIDWSSVFSSGRSIVDHRPVGAGARRVRRDGRLAGEHRVGGLGPRHHWEQARIRVRGLLGPRPRQLRRPHRGRRADAGDVPSRRRRRDRVRAGPAGPVGRHRRRDHRPVPARRPVLDRRRRRRLRHDQDRRALPGHLPDRLGRRHARSCWPSRSSATSSTTPSPRPAEPTGCRTCSGAGVSSCTTATTPSASAGAGAPPSTPGAPHPPRTSSGTCSASPPPNPATAVQVAPRPGAIERFAGAVPTPHGLVRVDVEDGQVRVDSPVPVRFVSLSGEKSFAAAGHSEFTL